MAEPETFGPLAAGRGEGLRNPGFPDRFTCPGCHLDHEPIMLAVGETRLIRCECGAPLRLELVMDPVATCTIADEDEEDEERD